MGRKKLTVEQARENFWSKVNKRPSGCWEWASVIRESKPGGIKYGKVEFHEKSYSAHRFSWFLTHGEFPKNLFVCHKCDNPLCVNPDHLFLGTNTDNMVDCKLKGRTSRGIGRPNAKLTDAAALEIAQRKITPTEARKKYGVSIGCACCVKYGKTWTHVTGLTYAPAQR
jgi:hypothetical protein